jgi:uncharacterized protein YxjI
MRCSGTETETRALGRATGCGNICSPSATTTGSRPRTAGAPFRVDGKALRIRKTFVLEDAAGNEVAKLQERKLSVRDKMEIERGGRSVATVKKALIGIRDRFSIELERGADLDAEGNLVDHEYEIKREATPSQTVSKRWFRIRDKYGVEIADGEDEALVPAITVCIDALSHPRE